MTTSNRHGGKSILRITIVLLIIAALCLGGWKYMQAKEAGGRAEQVLRTMYDLIPGLGVDSGTSTGRGRDPLVALSIQDIDIVGCLEIPALDIMVPVTAKGYEQAGFVSVVSGSPVKGNFRLIGSREDALKDLAEADPGDNVIFTDTDGVRYAYRVVTQFHLKSWDEADNDLMICYETDSQTQFVLGCTANY